MSRVILAFTLAPLVPFLFYVLLMGIGPGSLTLAFIIFGLPLAYGATILFGIPLYIFLRNKPYANTSVFCIFAGSGIGVLSGITVSVIADTEAKNLFSQIIASSLWFGIHGIVSGYVFWRIAKPELTKNLTKSKESHA